MLDINFLKQEDQNRKVSLLKQVKTSLESLMFDRSSNASANFAHSFNGVITMFCRCILAVLEDGIIIQSNEQPSTQNGNDVAMPFLFSSPSSLESSPTTSYSASPHHNINNNQYMQQTIQFFNSPSNSSSPNSRKTTMNSSSGVVLSQTSQALWSFVLYVFNEYYLQNSNETDDEKRKQLESVAYKDFKTIYAEITAKPHVNSIHFDIESMSNLSSSSCNIALEWISVSLRHRILLNQLVYVLSLDEMLMRQFYKANSFALDRSLIKDFLVYIRAFEEKNYDILNRVKCNFFNTIKVRSSTDFLKVETNNQQQQQPQHHQNSNTSHHRKQKSMDFVSTMNLNDKELASSSAPQNDFESEKLKLEDAISTHSLNSSLIELKINELNAMPKMRSSHRRMHSFPNIQVNILKKNSMMAANNFSITPEASSNVEEITDAPSRLMRIDSPESIGVDNIIPTSSSNNINVANQPPYMQLNNENKEIDELINKNDAPTANSKMIDIYEKADILDLIHAVQINCECSPLDKENSHFIMCDLTIAAIELMKTQYLDYDNEFEQITLEANKMSKKQPPSQITSHMTNFQSKLVGTNSIKINNKSVSSSNLFSSFESSVSNSLTSSTKQNSPLFFTLDQAETYSPIDTNTNASPVSHIMNLNEINRIGAGVNGEQSFSPNSKERKDARRYFSKQKSSFNRSISNSNSSTLNNINEIEQSCDTSVFSNSASNSKATNSIENLSNGHSIEKNTEILESSSNGPSNNSKIQSISINFENKPTSGNRSINDNEITNQKNTSLKKLEKLNQETKRERRYSWEKIEIDTAERISVRIIQNAFTHYEKLFSIKKSYENSVNKIAVKENYLKLPNLRMLEFFIQHLEYDEYMQNYFELRSSGKLKKYNATFLAQMTSPPTSSSDLSLIQKTNLPMSASTIFHSHFTMSTLPESSSESQLHTLNKKSPNRETGSSIFGSKSNKTISKLKLSRSGSVVASLSSTTFLKVKSAVFAAISAIRLSENQELYLSKTEKTSSATQISSVSNLNNINDLDAYDKISIISNDVNLPKNTLSQSMQSVSPSQSIISEFFKHQLSSGRILGDELWAPVREQLILNYAPKLKRLQQMQQQHFRCADCGIQIKADQIKTFYYCEYFSKYFCRCCHINQQSYIPAYIVNLLDFRCTFEVSKKAKNFLEKIYNEPLITLESINPSLFEHNSTFSKILKVRTRLYNSRSYINTCRFAAELKEELNTSYDDFIINSIEVYSIETLFKIKKTNYYETLKNIVNRIVEHIKTCILCSQQGYICGICPKNDLLYPFEFEKVEKCPNCLTCYHKTCLKVAEHCPRCLRKKNRLGVVYKNETSAQIIPLKINSSNNKIK